MKFLYDMAFWLLVSVVSVSVYMTCHQCIPFQQGIYQGIHKPKFTYTSLRSFFT